MRCPDGQFVFLLIDVLIVKLVMFPQDPPSTDSVDAEAFMDSVPAPAPLSLRSRTTSAQHIVPRRTEPFHDELFGRFARPTGPRQALSKSTSLDGKAGHPDASFLTLSPTPRDPASVPIPPSVGGMSVNLSTLLSPDSNASDSPGAQDDRPPSTDERVSVPFEHPPSTGTQGSAPFGSPFMPQYPDFNSGIPLGVFTGPPSVDIGPLSQRSRLSAGDSSPSSSMAPSPTRRPRLRTLEELAPLVTEEQFLDDLLTPAQTGRATPIKFDSGMTRPRSLRIISRGSLGGDGSESPKSALNRDPSGGSVVSRDSPVLRSGPKPSVSSRLVESSASHQPITAVVDDEQFSSTVAVTDPPKSRTVGSLRDRSISVDSPLQAKGKSPLKAVMTATDNEQASPIITGDPAVAPLTSIELLPQRAPVRAVPEGSPLSDDDDGTADVEKHPLRIVYAVGESHKVSTF